MNAARVTSGIPTPPPSTNLCAASTAADFASQRRFPDEAGRLRGRIGARALCRPGLAPGGKSCAKGVREYMAAHNEAPKLVLMENHGMVALGETPAEILNITAMAVKGARIYLGALLTGKPTRLPDEEVWHVYRRPRRDLPAQAICGQSGVGCFFTIENSEGAEFGVLYYRASGGARMRDKYPMAYPKQYRCGYGRPKGRLYIPRRLLNRVHKSPHMHYQ